MRSWAPEGRPTHFERLAVEEGLVWLWDPVLHDEGRQTAGTPEELRHHKDTLISGKRHRARHLLKFRRKATKTWVIKNQEVYNATKVQEGERGFEEILQVASPDDKITGRTITEAARPRQFGDGKEIEGDAHERAGALTGDGRPNPGLYGTRHLSEKLQVFSRWEQQSYCPEFECEVTGVHCMRLRKEVLEKAEELNEWMEKLGGSDHLLCEDCGEFGGVFAVCTGHYSTLVTIKEGTDNLTMEPRKYNPYEEFQRTYILTPTRGSPSRAWEIIISRMVCSVQGHPGLREADEEDYEGRRRPEQETSREAGEENWLGSDEGRRRAGIVLRHERQDAYEPVGEGDGASGECLDGERYENPRGKVEAPMCSPIDKLTTDAVLV